MGEQGGFVRFVPLYGGSLQVPGSLDRRRLVREHIHRPAHSGGLCPPVGVLVMSGPHLSHRERICRIGNTFVVTLILEVRALLWGFSSHWERVRRVICHPGHSRGSCPPMGVLFEFWEVQVVVAGECVHRVIHHPTRSVGFCPPVGVLFEFQEVQVVIVLSGMHSSCRSSSHLFRFVIWPSLSVSNA